MDLGIDLGFGALRWPTPQRAALVREIETLGFSSIWTSESTGGDGASLLAWAAAHTERVAIGSAVLQMPGRTPAMTAMTATALDRLSDGRLRLGIGASTRPVTEDWHGGVFAGQLRRTREYVAVLRQALGGGRVEHHGSAFDLPRTGAGGAPMRLVDRPIQGHVPIYLGAVGPRNVALCGEIADGWIPAFLSPEHVEEGRARLAEGAARVGRELEEDLPILVHAITAIADDVDTARDATRALVAVYVGMGPPERNLYQRLVRRLGFGAAAEQVLAHFRAGRVAEARAALPPELIDTMTLCGTPEGIAARLRAYRDAGATTVIAQPMASDPQAWGTTLRRLAELVPPASTTPSPRTPVSG